MASGVGVLVMSLTTVESLEETAIAYYERYRFGHVFARVERAPEHLVERLREIRACRRWRHAWCARNPRHRRVRGAGDRQLVSIPSAPNRGSTGWHCARDGCRNSAIRTRRCSPNRSRRRTDWCPAINCAP